MNKFQRRIKQYNTISTTLACLSNERLKQIMADAKPMHVGIGGKSALISIDEMPIFVKKVPLEISLREYIEGKRGELAPAIATTIKRYAPIALAMDTFFQKIQKESKSTPYPAIHKEQLLKIISSETT